MASGDLLADWTAADGETGPLGETAEYAVVNGQPVLTFNSATIEAVYVSGVLSSAYAGGGLTLTLIWTSGPATSGDCLWTCAIERQPVSHPVGTDSFATANTVTAPWPGTEGHLVYSTIAFTGAQMDALVVGERFRLLITRFASSVTDTMGGDAHLVAVRLTET
ncbi:MAG: hypothetical protein EHM24_24085 [Acidobacteria bacterium]|nr:MAG: hypothetical protein EHM24_24085 [Acidobacteriota bacterium]